MNVVLAVLAAAVAGVFALRLVASQRSRPRLHILLWSIAMGTFTLATIALAIGLAAGWTEPTFRVFYLLGAIVNIPLLAAGSVALVLGRRSGLRFAAAVVGFIVAGAVAVVLAPLTAPVERIGVPEGSELFDFTMQIGALSMPGPRVFAIVAGGLGTIVVVALSLWSAVRWWRDERRRSIANVFIVGGMLGPAFGGSLAALGEGGGLAVSLLVGAVLLYTGFVMASG